MESKLCRPCYQKDYYKNNPDKKRAHEAMKKEYWKHYKEQNKEKIKAYHKEYDRKRNLGLKSCKKEIC